MVSVVGSMGTEAPRYRSIAAGVLLVCVPLIIGFGVAAAACLGRRTPDNVLLGLHSEVRAHSRRCGVSHVVLWCCVVS